jgi:transcription-repair coupling factor (superfamily II helicase)
MIVERADTFGLAQLYQLRGRIGRGSRRAYAYLLIPAQGSLSEVAEKRLKTMLAATELGAGFQIAMKDLEIRGAGNLLGSAQSGHIHAVGFALYTKLLSDAVESLRARSAAEGAEGGGATGVEVNGQHSAEEADTDGRASVDLGIPASIPDDYVADLPTRLEIYRRLGGVADLEAVSSMESELLDRFGPPPWQVQNLLYVARLRLRAGGAGIERVTREGDYIVLRLRDEVGGARDALQRLLGRDAKVGHMQIRLDLEAMPDGWETPLTSSVERLAEFRAQLGV